MSEQQALAYDDFVWRVGQVAEENQLLPAGCLVSLPALSRTADDDGCRAYALSFLCEASDRAALLLQPPHARVGLFADGAVAVCERIAGGSQPPSARYSSLALQLSPQERRAFAQTYGELLTLPDSPLLCPWERVPPQRWRDLHALFHSLAEPSLQLVYQRYAADYLAALHAA